MMIGRRSLRWTVERGAAIVPDRIYKEPRYDLVATPEKIDSLLADRQFWVFHPEWVREDLLLKPVVNQHTGPGYYIAQRYGGPAIRYLLYPEKNKDGCETLGRGSVDYYPTYYSSIDRSEFPAPPGLVSFFRDVKDGIAQRSKKVVSRQAAAWISHVSLDAVRSGAKAVPSAWKSAIDAK